ncbi:MAG: winged helix DNA-binding domain-containing protein [Acidimicrobiia bacterium]|nr:winged helix DNA-binding domain-containing protein [Acidimicrobiia bacterium]
MRTLTLPQARRIALAAQGFADPRPSGRIDVRHFRRVIGRINLLQLDSVNVAVRAHYMPMFSRLGAYDRAALDAWINGPEMFEYLGHVASVMPTADLPMLRHRMSRNRKVYPRTQRVLKDHPEYIEQVLDEVAEHGPLTVSDLSDAGSRTGPWWGHGRGKVALDWLYVTGQLTIRGRTPTFVSIYDLPERIFARQLLGQEMSRDEAYRNMLLRAARAHGVGTLADLTDYYRITHARSHLEGLVAAGELEEVAVEGWTQPAYLHPSATLPRRIRARALLAPFDPVVWFRDRTERLFGFHYRIEIYVPEPQRQYGYYVYPFLLDDRLVARVDLKADRKAGVLRALGAFLEAGQDAARVAPELAAELQSMARWLGLPEVHVSNKGNLSGALRKAVGRAAAT